MCPRRRRRLLPPPLPPRPSAADGVPAHHALGGQRALGDDAHPVSQLIGLLEVLRREEDGRALLDEAGIPMFELDVNMSVLEGSIGILPRRIMVRSDELVAARNLMKAHDIEIKEI